MYEEYWISNEVAKVIEPYLCEKLDINNYDYFLSCEEENISYLKEWMYDSIKDITKV